MKQNQHIIGIIFVIEILLVSCQFEKPERVINPVGNREIAMSPTIKLEATVISLSIDTRDECEGKCPGYPRDSGIIRIDKIISIDNPDNVTLTMDEIKEGNKIKVRFFYSARPAKIKMVPETLPTTNPNDPTVSHVPSSAKPILKVDGYFIYVIESRSIIEETETILSGLDIGSRFTATINYASPTRISVAKYEII